MKGKSSEIRKMPTKVEMMSDALYGRFTKGKQYEVLGMFRHVYSDKSFGLYYILINDNGIVEDVDISYFKVIDI